MLCSQQRQRACVRNSGQCRAVRVNATGIRSGPAKVNRSPDPLKKGVETDCMCKPRRGGPTSFTYCAGKITSPNSVPLPTFKDIVSGAVHRPLKATQPPASCWVPPHALPSGAVANTTAAAKTSRSQPHGGLQIPCIAEGNQLTVIGGRSERSNLMTSGEQDRSVWKHSSHGLDLPYTAEASRMDHRYRLLLEAEFPYL